jgi:oligoribonuclease
MTGLELSHDALIEIAVVVTDGDLVVLDPGLDIVIHADDALLDGMLPVVRDMHANSKLTDAVRESVVTVPQAEEAVIAYLKSMGVEAGTAPLCGNSIGTDRGFITRDMAALDAYLHYRMIDVSSLKELARRWFPPVYYSQPPKGLAHRALADILESIQELRYYRSTLFVAAPGPTTEQARAAAAALAAS